MKYIFLRHCQTEWNDTKKLQGQSDIALNDAGKMQAKVLAEKIMIHRPTLIISSSLRRAAETAAIIAGALGLEIETQYDHRLRECSFGTLEGKTWSEIDQQFGVKMEDIWRGAEHPYDFTPYKGESRESVLRRHRDLFAEITISNHSCILFVGHRVGLSTLLTDLGEHELINNGDMRIIEHHI